MSSHEQTAARAVTFLFLLYWQFEACCPINSHEIQRDVFVCQSRYLRRVKVYCNSNEDDVNDLLQPFAECLQERISAKNLSLREVQDDVAFVTASSDLRQVCHTFRHQAAEKKISHNLAENGRLETDDKLFKKRVDDLILTVRELTTTISSAMFFETYVLLVLGVVLKGKLSVHLGIQQALIFLLGFVIANTLCIPLLCLPWGESLNLEQWLKNSTIVVAIFHLVKKLLEERLLTLDENEIYKQKLRSFYSTKSKSSLDPQPLPGNDALRTANERHPAGGGRTTDLQDFCGRISEGILWEKTSEANSSSTEAFRDVGVRDPACISTQSYGLTNSSNEPRGITLVGSQQSALNTRPTSTLKLADYVPSQEVNERCLVVGDDPDSRTVKDKPETILELGEKNREAAERSISESVVAQIDQANEEPTKPLSDQSSKESVEKDCTEENADDEESDDSCAVVEKFYNETLGSSTDVSDESFNADECDSEDYSSDEDSTEVPEGELQGLLADVQTALPSHLEPLGSGEQSWKLTVPAQLPSHSIVKKSLAVVNEKLSQDRGTLGASARYGGNKSTYGGRNSTVQAYYSIGTELLRSLEECGAAEDCSSIADASLNTWLSQSDALESETDLEDLTSVAN